MLCYAMLEALLGRLPRGNYALLRHLVCFLTRVVRHTAVSKMSVGNVSAVFIA